VGELGPYFREAAAWDADRAAQLRRSERIAWRIAAAGWLCAVAGAVALAMLTPLKRVDAFVVRVDNRTGIVDVVPAYQGSAPIDEAVTRYLLAHYITVCERFNFPTAESDYEECGAFHSAQRNQVWYALWDRNNPHSPLNQHKDGGSVRAEVESVSFFHRASGVADLVQVRYRKVERPGGGGSAAERISHWIASVQYAYGPPSKDPRTRQWNPLGLKVLEMHSEPEAREPELTVSAMAAARAADAGAP
jgi:type IV secretion system protein VirB8